MEIIWVSQIERFICDHLALYFAGLSDAHALRAGPNASTISIKSKYSGERMYGLRQFQTKLRRFVIAVFVGITNWQPGITRKRKCGYYGPAESS